MKPYTENQRQILLRKYRRFDGTQAEFRRTHQLSMGTLQNWYRNAFRRNDMPNITASKNRAKM